MTNYKIEYNKYLKLWADAPRIMPSFLQHLRSRREECINKRNYKRVQYYDELIQEETEETQIYDGSEAIEMRSDADTGL